MSLIDEVFAQVKERPCWNVERGHGSFLTFEFGNPRLAIREPIHSKTDISNRVRKALAKRFVRPQGRWHLWIYCCEWKVFENDRLIADSSAKRKIESAAGFLNGQKLTAVRIPRRGARTVFEFDLGGRLETRPYDRRSTQWLFYEPTGQVLKFRADRHVSYARSDENDPEEWVRLP